MEQANKWFFVGAVAFLLSAGWLISLAQNRMATQPVQCFDCPKVSRTFAECVRCCRGNCKRGWEELRCRHLCQHKFRRTINATL
ncbi:hypothetical protein M2350_000005 [Candidatus Fervidibacter sacchari]|uniref:Uncharacterized protein n=1 Tax=Candidatus Fervidibacter sacchari TaxID=1448929 RepID=A0ABT2EKX6_9BACT|nr:hypothetical protein [Candidatus Fervidibacter sacchari]